MATTSDTIEIIHDEESKLYYIGVDGGYWSKRISKMIFMTEEEYNQKIQEYNGLSMFNGLFMAFEDKGDAERAIDDIIKPRYLARKLRNDE